MAYDRDLANRLREVLAAEDGVSEKAMFGGLAFLLHGRLTVAASGRGGLLLRVDPDDTDVLVRQRDVERMVMRGRVMDGWLHVQPAGVESDDELTTWVARGVAFTRTLAPK